MPGRGQPLAALARLTGPALGLVLGLGLTLGLGCNQIPVLPVDQLPDQAIPFWPGPQGAQLPVFVGPPLGADPCASSPGSCSDFCDKDAAQCSPGSCGAVLLDSLAPLSSSVISGIEQPRYQKSCAQIRRPPLDGKNQSEVQMRTYDLGTLELPASQSTSARWTLGDGRVMQGVLGGDFLLQFAAELRFARGRPPEARFFRRLAGSERRLSNRGLSYLAAQSPGQFLGRVPGDQCELAPGLDCERPILQLGNLETQKIMPPSRLQLDVCMAPPSCGLVMEPNASCKLAASSDPSAPCQPWKESHASGASLVLATGFPGVAIFSDSAERIFPKLDALPACDRGVQPVPGAPPTPPYCRMRESNGSLHLPGWPPLTGLSKVKVASLAVLSGKKSQYSLHPCERWEQRMRGLLSQCQAFSVDSYASYPQNEVDLDPQLAVNLEHPLFQAGMLRADASNPQSKAQWLEVTIIPASAPIVSNLRRSSGTFAVQADGLLGLSVFDQTRVYLDFTERELSPGLRVQCLEPQEGSCRSLPSCRADRVVGDPSCCHGLSQPQLLQAVLAAPPALRPHPCCAALGESARQSLPDPSFCD